MEFLPHHLGFVTGVSVNELARPPEPQFEKIRPHDRTQSRGHVYDALNDAYERREEHPAVLFSSPVSLPSACQVASRTTA